MKIVNKSGKFSKQILQKLKKRECGYLLEKLKSFGKFGANVILENLAKNLHAENVGKFSVISNFINRVVKNSEANIRQVVKNVDIYGYVLVSVLKILNNF